MSVGGRGVLLLDALRSVPDTLERPSAVASAAFSTCQGASGDGCVPSQGLSGTSFELLWEGTPGEGLWQLRQQTGRLPSPHRLVFRTFSSGHALCKSWLLPPLEATDPPVQASVGVDVTVVGAGVIGLTTAVELQRTGHSVQVVAAATGPDTTSAVAGALWFPFRADPPDRVNVWAKRSRERLVALATAVPAAGVDVLTAYEAATDSAPPWWAPSTEGVAYVESSPLGCPAFRFRAPRVEPLLFLAWLEGQLERPLRRERVTSLEALPGDVVVNCTGLGARTLAGDASLQAVYGQVLLVEPGTLDMGVSLGDERDVSAMLYAIPRRLDVVLGGCALPCPDDTLLAPDPGLRKAILARARAAGLGHGRVLAERAGLRPCRPTVRLERQGRLLHNYGHGGAGYTLAYGCAEEAVALLAG